MRLVFASALLLLFSTSAFADDATGEWLVEEETAHVRIENCGGRMWGAISWEKEPGIDIENPDPKKRGRSTTGLPIILGMAPAGPNRWEGDIYNASNGRTYSASLTLQPKGSLRVRGCVLGILCGGEDWRRITPKTPPEPAADFCAKLEP